MSERPRDIEITDPVQITVNGEPVTVQNGELVIDACERNGSYIPRFCYHPRMNPVGMCRMCLVEIDTGRGPALQPSCMINVAPDMTVTTDSPMVSKAQDGVLEFLLANHPLDCPVCDKGGECPLQDQTMAYGPGESRWVEEKRHYEKPIAISETVFLDRERCILCDRCTRFASEVADDPLIHFIDRGSNTEVNTFPGEPFSSYFSGNTVQICPVGALTAKPYRFRARPWDLEETESTCTSCCGGLPGHRAVQPQPGAALPGCGLGPGELVLAVRQGPVRVRGRQLRGPPDRAAHAGRGPRAGPGPLVRCPGGRHPRHHRRPGRQGPRVRRGAGWRPPHQRVRLRLGQAGQGRHRHRPHRRPDG